jgi:hypothetical protein
MPTASETRNMPTAAVQKPATATVISALAL